MKSTGRAAVKSVFWSRLLGLLIAFAIVAVLVFGGVKNLMSELAAAHQAGLQVEGARVVDQPRAGDFEGRRFRFGREGGGGAGGRRRSTCAPCA